MENRILVSHDVLSYRAAQGRGRAFPRGGKASSRGFFCTAWMYPPSSQLPPPFASIQFQARSPSPFLPLVLTLSLRTLNSICPFALFATQRVRP